MVQIHLLAILVGPLLTLSQSDDIDVDPKGYLVYCPCMGMCCKNPKNWTPEKHAVIIPKFEQCGFTIEQCIQKMQTEWQAV